MGPQRSSEIHFSTTYDTQELSPHRRKIAERVCNARYAKMVDYSADITISINESLHLGWIADQHFPLYPTIECVQDFEQKAIDVLSSTLQAFAC